MFDNNGIINYVVYLGYEDISMSSLVSFVGLSQNYLNQLGIRLKSGLIPNVTEFLSENWAMGLYHEWFSEFRYIVKCDLLANDDMMKVMKEIQEMARNGGYLTEDYYKKMKDSLKGSVVQQIKVDFQFRMLASNFLEATRTIYRCTMCLKAPPIDIFSILFHLIKKYKT